DLAADVPQEGNPKITKKCCLKNLAAVGVISRDLVSETWIPNKSYQKRNADGKIIVQRGHNQYDWQKIQKALLPKDPLALDEKRKHRYQDALKLINKQIPSPPSPPAAEPPKEHPTHTDRQLLELIYSDQRALSHDQFALSHRLAALEAK